MFYFIITLIFAVYLNLYNFYPKENSKSRVVLYYVFALAVAAIAGLRGNEDEYTRIYFATPDLSEFSLVLDSTKKEFIFKFIVSLFKTFSLGPHSIFIFFSSVAVLINAYFFRKMTPYYTLAFMIYLCHNIMLKEFSGLRLGYASALVLPMIYYLEKRSHLKFSLLYILSSLVQYVGLLSIFLIFLNKRIKHIYLWGGLVIALFMYKAKITLGIVDLLNGMHLLPEIVSDYLGSIYHTYNAGIFTHFKTIQQIVFIIIMLLLSERYRNYLLIKKSDYFNLVLNTYYLSTVLLITFSSFAIFAFRFAAHFAAVEPIIIGYMIWCFKDKKIIVSALSIIFLGVAYYNYVVLHKLSDFYFFWSVPV